MIKKTFNVQGMHCASCSIIIIKELEKLTGIKKVDVNFATEKANLELENEEVSVEQMNDRLEKLGYSLYVKDDSHVAQLKDKNISLEDNREKELSDQKAKIQFVMPITLLIFIVMMWDILSRTFFFIPNIPIPMQLFNIISMVLATIVMFWVGKPFILGVTRFIQYRVANMDTLVGIGTLTAYFYSTIITLLPQVKSFIQVPDYTYFDVVIVVIGFVAFGKYLEARSKQKNW